MTMRSLAFAAAVLLSSSSLAEYVNPIDYPHIGDPTDIQVVIEIPAGTFTKYEFDAKTGSSPCLWSTRLITARSRAQWALTAIRSTPKIVAVPISKVDPSYDEIKTADDLPAIERRRIEQFFAVYKKLPDGRHVVEMKGYDGVNAAVDMVNTGLDKFKTTEVSTSVQ